MGWKARFAVDSTRQPIQNYVLSGGRVDDETNKLFIQRVYFVLQYTFLIIPQLHHHKKQ